MPGRPQHFLYFTDDPHQHGPTIGFLIIGYELINADTSAKIGGIVWLIIGGIIFATNMIRGRGVPDVAEERTE
jgi:hypothetical protein